jgi:hypothetical protein
VCALACSAIGADVPATTNAVPAARSLSVCVDRAWQVTWTRFYREETHLLYDYLTSYEPGRELALLPTAAEVARQYPNPCGYGTGMEDCMISAGLAMSLVLDRFAVTHDDALRARADALYQGIKLCSTVHGVPGFVARGVCIEDRKGTYANSSRDQYTHAVHGLWLYFHSPLCPAERKAEIAGLLAGIADRMTRNVTAANNYDSLRSDGTHDTLGISRMWNVKGHEAARLPMIYAAAWDATGRQEYLDLCNRYLAPSIEQSASVEERQPTYAFLQMQTSLDLLKAVVSDADTKRRIQAVMATVSARCARRALMADQRAPTLDLMLLGTDWRKTNGIPDDRRKAWTCLRESGEAALAELMDTETAFSREQQTLLARAFTRLDDTRVAYNGIFALQAAYWKARRLGAFAEEH